MIDVAFVLTIFSGPMNQVSIFERLDDVWDLVQDYLEYNEANAELIGLDHDDWQVFAEIRREIEDEDMADYYGVEWDEEDPHMEDQIIVGEVLDISDGIWRYIDDHVACEYMLGEEYEWLVLYLNRETELDHIGRTTSDFLTHQIVHTTEIPSIYSHPEGLSVLACLKCPGWLNLVAETTDPFDILEWEESEQQELYEHIRRGRYVQAKEMLLFTCDSSNGARFYEDNLHNMLGEAPSCDAQLKQWQKEQRKRHEKVAEKMAKEWEDVLF